MSDRRPEDILVRLGIERPPIDVFEVARALEIEVVQLEMPGWDCAVRTTEKSKQIWLDQAVLPRRKRFNLAHAIGHVQLHPLGEYRDSTYVPDTTSTQEREANNFAGKLLMPEEMTYLGIRVYSSSAFKLADLFDVSPEAMNWRLKALGLR